MEPQPLRFDAEEMRLQFKALVEGAAADLLEGAAEDMILYAERISQDYTAAMLLPDPAERAAVLDELTSQLALLGEIHRLRAVNKGWEMFSTVIGFSVRAAIAGIIAAA